MSHIVCSGEGSLGCRRYEKKWRLRGGVSGPLEVDHKSQSVKKTVVRKKV